jgi:hypothetical protein
MLAACLAAALLAGCSSDIPDDIRSALGPRESPRSQVFQADRKATYAAVKSAVDEMGFRFVRGGPAEGMIEAHSAVGIGDEPNSSRQIAMKVHLNDAGAAGTEVEVSLIEVIEADSTNQQGMATETPLHDTPLYSVFFRDVQNALTPPATQ